MRTEHWDAMLSTTQSKHCQHMHVPSLSRMWLVFMTRDSTEKPAASAEQISQVCAHQGSPPAVISGETRRCFADCTKHGRRCGLLLVCAVAERAALAVYSIATIAQRGTH
jgi:hypothetical protein